MTVFVKPFSFVIYLFVFFLSMASVMAAPDTQKKEQKAELNDELVVVSQNFIRAGRTVSTTKEDMIRNFVKIDIDGKGVSKADYDIQSQLNSARQRSYKLRDWIHMDLDASGEVTREEAKIFYRSRARKTIRHQGVEIVLTQDQVDLVLKKLVDKFWVGDENKDDVLSYSEAVAHAKNQNKRFQVKDKYSFRQHYYKVPLSLDGDGDNSVSQEEYSQAVDHFLAHIDTDKNGEFSKAEVNSYRQSVYPIRRSLRR